MRKILLVGVAISVSLPVVSIVACSNIKDSQDNKGSLVEGNKPFGDDGIENILPSKRILDLEKNDYIGDFTNEKQKEIFLNSKEEIQDEQFKGEKNIEEISLPFVKTIGDKSFQESQISEVSLPTATKIGINSFEEASLRSLSLPKVKEVDRWAFQNSSVDYLSLPKAETLGDAFIGIVNSPSTFVVLPEKFNSLSELARIFIGPTNKVNIIWIAADEKKYSNQLLMTKPKIIFDNNFEGSFVKSYGERNFLDIQNLVQDYWFKDETKLTEISLPGVSKVGDNAFQGCYSLERVSLPYVKTIGHESFLLCRSLKYFEMPLLEEVGNYAFFGTKIRTLDLPKTKTIGIKSFDTSTLQSVLLPSVVNIGERAFQHSSITSLSLPKVQSIQDGAFEDSKIVSATLPKVQYIGKDAFKYSIFSNLYLPNIKTTGSLLQVINDPSTKITLPKSDLRTKWSIIKPPFDKVTFEYI